MRLVAVAKVDGSSGDVQQRASRESVLLAHVGEPGGGVVPGGTHLRCECRDAVVGRVVAVDEQSAGEDVGGGEVYLDFAEVAAAQQAVVVGAKREPRDVNVVVFHLQAVEEPSAVARQRPGKGYARDKLIKTQAIQIANGGNKIRGIEVKLVVAHPGVEGDDPAGGPAEFHGVAGRLRVDGANRVGTDAHG